MVRRQYLEETMGELSAQRATAGIADPGEKVDRKSLEEEAREGSLKGNGTPDVAFWLRQRNQQETIQIGTELIRKAAPESKKKQ